jgi:hypothetical protein
MNLIQYQYYLKTNEHPVHPQYNILQVSYWTKLSFIILELLLTVTFLVSNVAGNYNIAAIFEWAVSFAFSFYIFSFFIDLLPASFSKFDSFQKRPAQIELHFEINGGIEGLGNPNTAAESGNTNRV